MDALEDTPEMAEDMKLYSSLVMGICEAVENRQHPHAEAARQLGMAEPRFNDLMAGKIDQFTLDDRIVVAIRAGLNMENSTNEIC